MLKNKIWFGIILSILILVFSINGFTAYYKYTQESGANFYVGTGDKSDALEDTNQVRQILDDLGNLLGHSKRNDSYPADSTTGGTLSTFNNYYLKTAIDTIGEVEAIWVKNITDSTELATALTDYYLKTAIDAQGEMETIWGVTLATDAELAALTYSDVGAEQADAGLTSLAGLTYASDSFIKVTATDVYAIRTIAETKTDLALNNVENLKVKLDGTDAPAVTDDVDLGYAVGSRWFDITNDKEYVCLDNTDGAAVWTETTGAGSGATTFLGLTDTPAAYTGQAGKYTKVNAGETALEFDTPAGAGTVTTSGTPVQYDYARFTDATTIEGRSYAEAKSDLDIGTNIVLCSSYDHPDNAITAISTDNKTLLVTEAETCDLNFTVPANVTVKFERGGKWTINTGITVTINGQVEAGLFEIFTYVGTGICTLSKNTEIYPEWWGAVADGETDDYTALSRTVTVAAGLRWIELQAYKIYLINTELSLHTGTEGVKLNGNFATIKAGAAITNVISVGDTTTRKVQLRDLIIDADDVATYGIYLMMVTETNSLIQNCSVTKAISHGWYLQKCQAVRFENVRAHVNGGAGFFIDDCNASTFDSIRSTSNTDNGITVQKTDFTGGCQIFNMDVEANSEYGIEIVNTLSPVTIKGGWIEGNTKDGILIGGSARGVSVHSVGITGGDVGNVYRAVRLNDGAAGCDIVDNKFAYSAGTQFGNVVDESSSFNRIYPNYYRSSGAILGNTTPVIGEMITHNTVGMGGYLAGGESISIGASGSKTFTFTPSGTFNIPGVGDRGAYLVEIDFVGYFAGIDETCFKRFHVYIATNAAIGYDGSVATIYARGNSRESTLTGATPTAAGSSTFAVVFSNADDSSFDGYFMWRVIMTTKGKLTLEVT